LDLKELIDEILSIYKVMLESRKMHVELELEKNSVIYMDKNMASTIFRNLIDNAIKYSDEESSIKISSHTESNFQVIKIKDNGKGITEEEIKSIIDNSTTSTFTKNSASLGLQLSIQMTKLAKGELGVQSVFGKGSIFTIKLPNQPQG